MTAPWETSDASLDLTNYPAAGPIVSGPRVALFICQTSEFPLPDGSTLGAPLDEDCSAATRVQYVYMPVGGSGLEPMPFYGGASRRRVGQVSVVPWASFGPAPENLTVMRKE